MTRRSRISYPAKFARGLVTRIYKHMLAEGWLRAGDTVFDPFGGVGNGGIIAASMGLRWTGIELERRFWMLGNGLDCPGSLAAEADLCPECTEQAKRGWEEGGRAPHRFVGNFDLHKRTWEQFGDPLPVLLLGDSRQACKLVSEAAACVSSPPYADGTHGTNGSFRELRAAWNDDPKNAGKPGFRPNQVGDYDPHSAQDAYGTTPGQLGAMKPGNLDAALSSPPFVATDSRSQGTHGREGPTRLRPPHDTTDMVGENYGTTAGQLGAMPAGDIAAAVSSPPYEGSFNGAQETPETTKAAMRKRGCSEDAIAKACTPGSHTGSLGYGTAAGNIGNDTGPTFWTAAREIVQQTHQLLKPGGYAAWVTKRYVKNGKLIEFSNNWQSLCESCGFVMVQRIRAMLTKTWEENTLFDGLTIKEKKRASFFRRLAEKKGSPKIDWEDVIIMRKPE